MIQNLQYALPTSSMHASVFTVDSINHGLCHLKKNKRSVNKFLLSDSGKFQNNMVYRPISKDLKDCALWLISHEYAPKDICKLFNISRRSITSGNRMIATTGPSYHHPIQSNAALVYLTMI